MAKGQQKKNKEEKKPLVDRLKIALADAEKRYETTSLTKDQEKKLL